MNIETKKINKLQISKFKIVCFILLLSIFSFNFAFAADTTPPTVDLTYSSNPTGVGVETITATYSEAVSGTPTISINQPGSLDITNAAMSLPGTTWTAQTIPANGLNSWHSIAYGNGTWVAVSVDGTNRVMTSPDGVTWTPRVAIQQNSWQSITYGNGLFVAVSSTGTNRVMTSPDGITWTARSASAARTWFGVTYSGSLFVAVSNDGYVMSSVDGITWSNQTPASNRIWQSITYGNGLFVAVSQDGFVMTSPDGTTWTNRTAAQANSWMSVTYGNGLFVAVSYNGPNRVMTSPDGINWTSRNPTPTMWYSVAYGNGLFAAVAVNGSVMTSSDGINWTDQYPPVTPQWYSIGYGNGMFVAVPINGTNQVITTSGGFFYNYTVNKANGSTYMDGTATVSLSTVTDLAGNPASAPTHNTFVIDTSGPSVALTYTKNPTNAGIQTITATYSKAFVGTPTISINQPGTTDITNAAMSGSGLVYSYDYTVNAANGSTYVDGTATVSLSTVVDANGNDSTPPTNATFEIDTTGPTAAITYSKNPAGVGTTVISANYSETITGTPTISINQPGTTDISNAQMNVPGTWTALPAAAQNDWQFVTYGNGLFVAVAQNGTNRVMTSPDGITWTARTAAEANSWQSVTYGNGLFVAVSSDGTNRVMTSPDGLTWTPRTAIQANSWQSVTYGNGLFVAVASDGTNRVMTSPDGITWTGRTAAEANSWMSVTYGNNLYVAVALSGTNRVMTSPDGITWTGRSAAEANSWLSVTYGNGLYVAVSQGGTSRVMTSPDGITWTGRTAAEANPWQAVTYGNNLFVAVASVTGANRAMTSPDGITWTARSTVANDWSTVTYGNGAYVAISNTGTNRVMISFAGTGYSYAYTVNKANGSTYVDGIATVTLSSVSDALGNSSNATTNNTFTIDTLGPTVALTYSKNPAGTGAMTITATYSKNIIGTPNISINQPGSLDISNAAMTGSGTTWTYSYTVNKANGTTYIDGTANVSLSTVTDAAGNDSSAPTNASFVIDTLLPSATISYSPNHPVKNGDSLLITANFNKPMADNPVPKISLTGVNTLSATNMTKVDNTHYTYNFLAGTGNGTNTITLSDGTDLAGNIIDTNPTSGASFSIDNTLPTVTVTPVCSIAGNNCTSAGQGANPQQSYYVQSLTGTASDSALSTIQVSIKDTATNKWFNGTSFTDSSENFLPASGTTSWAFDSSTAPMVINNIYLVNVKATDTALNSTTQSMSFQFTNSPPVVSNVTASEDSNGQVNVTFDVSDVESSQTTNYLFYGVGSTLSGNINDSASSLSVSNGSRFPSAGNILIDDEIISYSNKTGDTLNGLTRGALNSTAFSHSTGATIYIHATSATPTGLINKGTGKTISWIARNDISYENPNEIIKVVANDGSSGSMIGSMVSAAFSFDSKTPNAVVTFDAGVSGVANSGTITIPMPADQSAVQYQISDDSATETNPITSPWTTITTDTTIPWNFDSDVEVKTIKYQFKDAYGNISTQTSTSTPAPIPADLFLVQDASNASVPLYDIYIGWKAASAIGFSSYKLEFATSSDNVTYSSFASVPGGNITDSTTNYYVHRLLDSNLFYRYRLGIVGTNGNTSVRTGAFTTAKPDGIQNYGEGTGALVDTVKPTITLIGASSISLNVGDTYTDAGATASDTYNSVTTDLTSSITVAGIPHSPVTEGNYTIMYTVSDSAGNTATATRTVNVTFASTYNITATAGLHGTISPTGVTAVTTGNDQIYTITPSENYKVGSLSVDGIALANNTTYTFSNVKMTHTISVTFSPIDTLPPVITILGDNPMNINTGTVFTDPGATAVKAVTGEAVTVTASGTVNTNVGATGIKITYTATDDNGNTATAVRTVNVIDVTPPVISNISTPVVTSSQIAIVWETNEPADGMIMYGTVSGTYDKQTTLISTLLKNHLVAISDLAEKTDYYYVIVSADADGNVTTSSEQTFTTTAVEKVVVGGGGGGMMGVAQSVYDALLAQNENYKSKFGTDLSIPEVSNIQVSDITAFGATVSFSTSKETIGFINYGKDESYGLLAADDVLSKNHTVKISGLTLGTLYNFKVKAMDRMNNLGYSTNQTFTTKFLTENIDELKKIENVEQFQAEIESTIESILPSLVPPFIDKPVISNITESTVTVSFRTNIKSYSIVNFMTDKDYVEKGNLYDGEVSDTREKTIEHKLELVGLKPNTKYHVMAKAFSLPQVVGKSDDLIFTTAASKIQASVANIKTDSFTVVWTTDEPTSSIVEYKNVKTGIISRVVDDTKNTSHSIKIENLSSGTPYQISVSGVNKEGNVIEAGSQINIKTPTDTTPPVISNVKVDNTLIVGQTNRVQTIISWQTDKPSTSIVYYEGGAGSIDKELANKQEDLELTKNHAIILTTFKPGTIYRFTVSSVDGAGNVSKLPIRTVITPQKGESIMDIIFKNFDQTFNFINNVR